MSDVVLREPCEHGQFDKHFYKKPDRALESICEGGPEPSVAEVIEWLRQQPMDYIDAAELDAVAFAKAVEAALGGDDE